MQDNGFAGVGKKVPVAGIKITFGRQAFSEQNAMRVKLDMEILNRVKAGFRANCRSVHQLAGADQLAIDQDPVIRGYQQVPVRNIIGDCIALDTNGSDGFGSTMRFKIDQPLADPFYPLRDNFTAYHDTNEIAGAEILDSGFSFRRGDPGRAGKADDRDSIGLPGVKIIRRIGGDCLQRKEFIRKRGSSTC